MIGDINYSKRIQSSVSNIYSDSIIDDFSDVL